MFINPIELECLVLSGRNPIFFPSFLFSVAKTLLMLAGSVFDMWMSFRIIGKGQKKKTTISVTVKIFWHKKLKNRPLQQKPKLMRHSCFQSTLRSQAIGYRNRLSSAADSISHMSLFFLKMCGPTISLTLHCDDDDDNDDDGGGLSRHMGRKNDSNMVHEIAKIRFYNVMFAHVTRWCRFFTCYTFMTPTSLATRSQPKSGEHEMLSYMFAGWLLCCFCSNHRHLKRVHFFFFFLSWKAVRSG